MAARSVAGFPLVRACGLFEMETLFGDDDFQWTYANQASWASLQDSDCGAEGWQAPVDIQTSQAFDAAAKDGFTAGYPLEEETAGDLTVKRLGALSWSHASPFVNVSLTLAAGTWRADIQPPHDTRTKATYGNEDFFLKSFTFHAPSEIWVDGRAHDMELQLLHASSRGILITSVPMQVGLVPDSDFVAQLWPSFLQLEPGSEPVYKYAWSPYVEALPTDRTFFAFNGSLSTPPCTLSTIWVAFREPLLISRAQRDLFRQRLNVTSPGSLYYGALDGSAPGGAPALPPGVTTPWDLTVGSNSRVIQRASTHEVVLVEMQAGVPVTTPGPEVPPYAWVWLVLGLLTAVLCCGSVLLVGFFLCFRRQDGTKSAQPRGSSRRPLKGGGYPEEESSWRSLSRASTDTETSRSPRVQAAGEPPPGASGAAGWMMTPGVPQVQMQPQQQALPLPCMHRGYALASGYQQVAR